VLGSAAGIAALEPTSRPTNPPFRTAIFDLEFLMTSTEQDTAETPAESTAGAATEEQKKQKLELGVKVSSPSACQRHLTVTIPRTDIDRYFDQALNDLVPKAAVRGFRAGRAPRKLVQAQFKEDLKDRVKGALLMDSVTQVTEEQKFAAISEPQFDVEAIEVPDEGPMSFEFNIEVRPEFDLPQWKGLKLERPKHEINEPDVSRHLAELLRSNSDLVPIEEPAQLGDYVIAKLTVMKGDQVVSEEPEHEIVVRPVATFPDGRIENFDKLMVGAKAGDVKTAAVTIGDDSPNEALRGEKVELKIEVLDVKRLELQDITPELLAKIGDGSIADEAALREVARKNLERQLRYHQSQRIRQQITALLTAAANWELPPDLLKRQSRRELDRAVLELRSAGFSDEAIREHANELRQSTAQNTSKALKEHFILERIAEEEKISAEPKDYDMEVAMIAAQRGESPRRVRAQLEKSGKMDVLHNQVVERKVITAITEAAEFKDVDFDPRSEEVSAIDFFLGGDPEAAIPEAKSGGDSKPLPNRPARF